MRNICISLAALTLTALTASAQARSQEQAQEQQGQAPMSAQASTQEQPRWAVTVTSSNNLRSAPDYESPLESQTLMGSILSCTGERDRYWVEVSATSPRYDNVWTTDLTLAFMDDKALAEYIAADKYICTAQYSHVYESPSATSGVICDLVMGDVLRKVYNDKGSLERHIRYAKVLLPDGRAGYVRFADILDMRDWAAGLSADAKSILATAKKFVGTPYLWGGNTVKGMDCSGLLWLSWYMHGVLLPRNANEMAECGEEVALDAMQAGDLIFFAGSPDGPVSHVAMYLGDHKIIHSSQLVRINSLAADDRDYYKKDILCARRIIGHIDDGTGAVSILRSPWYFKQ